MDDDGFGRDAGQPATRVPEAPDLVIDLTAGGPVAGDAGPTVAVVPPRRRRALPAAVAAVLAVLAVGLVIWAVSRSSEPPAATTTTTTTSPATTTTGVAPPQPTAVIDEPLVEERPAPAQVPDAP
jgi:hypothetical protein